MSHDDAFAPYETGLRRLLARLGAEHPRYQDVLTLQARMQENILLARMQGDTEARRADRMQILQVLNALALDTVGESFNALSHAEACSEAGPPQAPPDGPRVARAFIAYRRQAEPDAALARRLRHALAPQGHVPPTDPAARAGEAWPEAIDRRIRESDVVVALLSATSAESEMLQAQLHRAQAYRKVQGHPRVLPVRVAYDGRLPYALDAVPDPLPTVSWQDEADTARVLRAVLEAVDAGDAAALTAPPPPVIPPQEVQPVTLSEDGHVLRDVEAMAPPLPAFDPRALAELAAPGGAVKLRDRFYVTREADAALQREVLKRGATTTIRAARQTGKSSLLVRGAHHAREHGARVALLDLQRVDAGRLTSPDVFLRDLATFIVHKLRLDRAEVAARWESALGPQDKLTYLMEDYVLPQADAPIVLALDEADRLLQTAFYKDFFALIRAWHNSRAFDPAWNRLNIVMVISTEPYLLIPDVTQSPFNVGLKLYLEDFDVAQVEDLNRRHGAPVAPDDVPALLDLLGGHPYLTRKALYTLVTEPMTWAELSRVADDDHGPFGEHLRRYYWLLRDEPDLRAALRQVIRRERCDDDLLFFRLLRAGLVKGSGDVCMYRCGLYRRYFEDKL